MQKIQIITSPVGEEMVVLAKTDYDAMIAALDEAAEDNEDVAIYDARKKEMTTDGVLPPDVSMSILRGDNRLKALRRYRGKSQVELSSSAGITQGFLSDLEGGRRNLTDTVAESLAHALEVPAEWLKA